MAQIQSHIQSQNQFLKRVLIQNAEIIATMDDERRELSNAHILIEDGKIIQIGNFDLAAIEADEIINAEGCVITPGLVNTHHHLYQTLTRVVPEGQDALLFGWLQSLYPIWAKFEPEDMFISAQLGLAELALSGCTMSSDHLYLFPNGVKLEDTIEAAKTIGIRFHATRGAMSLGESDGGLPPDNLVENEGDIIKDFIRVVDRFHDAGENAMVKVALAPCSPFSVTRNLMREAADLAYDKGVMLHTHLAENDEDIAYSIEKFGCRPGQYVEDLGWTGEHVWHAHCVKLSPEEITLFARTKTGVAHCPCSNCRLGSGIAPIRLMRDSGVHVGLGVDGSASNDSGHLLNEARQALLMQRVQNGADAMSARETLEIATRGGAEILGRLDQLGSLEVGKRADLAIWDVSGIEAAGNWDALAALILCGPFKVRDLLVNGEAKVRDGNLMGHSLEAILTKAQMRVKRLMEKIN